MNRRGDIHGGFSTDEPSQDRHRRGGRPRHLLVAPLVWGLHFGFVYGASALACSERALGLGTARVLVALASAIALALLAWASANAWRLRRGLAAEPETPARRQRCFLATTTLSTSALAAVAVVFDTLPVLVSASCS